MQVDGKMVVRQDDVEKYVGRITPQVKAMDKCDTARIVVIGYGYGAANAIEAVRRLNEVITSIPNGPKAEISLVLIDAIDPKSKKTNEHAAGAGPYTAVPADVLGIVGRRFGNYFQKVGGGPFNLKGRPIGGAS